MADEKKKKKWIKAAIKHPGAMTEAAEREGVSNSKYIAEHKNDGGKSGQRARLAETLKGMHHKRRGANEMQDRMYGKARKKG